MDPKDLIEFREKKIILPPGLLCPKWEGVIDIMTVEKMLLMHEHLGNGRYNMSTPVYYLVKNCAFKLFMLGNTPRDASALFEIPLSTARGLHKVYLKEL